MKKTNEYERIQKLKKKYKFTKPVKRVSQTEEIQGPIPTTRALKGMRSDLRLVEAQRKRLLDSIYKYSDLFCNTCFKPFPWRGIGRPPKNCEECSRLNRNAKARKYYSKNCLRTNKYRRERYALKRKRLSKL